jgi:hypothetical protein
MAEFRIGDGDWVRGGSGTVQALPCGVAHAIRVPAAIVGARTHRR